MTDLEMPVISNDTPADAGFSLPEAQDAQGQENAPQEPVEAVEQKQSDPEERYRKAISNRDKTIGATRARLEAETKARAALEARIAEMEAKLNAPKEPNPADYADYGEYHVAKTKYALQQEGLLGGGKQQDAVDPESIRAQAYQEAQAQVYLQQKAVSIEQRADEVATKIPDYAATMDMAKTSFNDLPPEIQNVFFLVEDPVLAAYALEKEGMVESLAEMHPYQAAMAIQAAQTRGQQALDAAVRRGVSNAPAPITGAKGTKSGSVDPMKLDDEAFRKRYKL